MTKKTPEEMKKSITRHMRRHELSEQINVIIRKILNGATPSRVRKLSKNIPCKKCQIALRDLAKIRRIKKEFATEVAESIIPQM